MITLYQTLLSFDDNDAVNIIVKLSHLCPYGVNMHHSRIYKVLRNQNGATVVGKNS